MDLQHSKRAVCAVLCPDDIRGVQCRSVMPILTCVMVNVSFCLFHLRHGECAFFACFTYVLVKV